MEIGGIPGGRGTTTRTSAPLTGVAQVRHRTGTAPTANVAIVTTTVPALPAPSGTLRPRRPGERAPRWPRAALTALLAATAVLYLWGLSRSGWANAFYSAAAQAGGESWKAWFFGSSDAANAVTVDKTPAALWVTGLSVRLFGLSSWSVLVPQALMGVASVGLLYAAVKRVAGPSAGLIAGAALALTPVAVLIFRFNNPDALLVLVLVGAAHATVRAVEQGGTRWLVLAGVLVGVGFLAKMLQAFLVLPALTAVWLLAAPVGWWRRIRGLLLAGVAMLVSAGWWVLVVELWPTDSRPYIGGSQTNSVLELVFGYNGFGRLTGDETGSVGGSPGGGWGRTGITRLFGSEMAGGASWLLPAALVLLGVLLWRTRRTRAETPSLRAATVLWGGWLLVTGLTFSFMAGIIHPYYTVALAPAIAALVGLGVTALWRDRATLAARATLAVVLAMTVGWAWYLLAQTGWQPRLAWTVPVAGLAGVVGLLGVHRMPRTAVVGVATLALVAGAGGSTAYALATAATPHTGAIPSAGPAAAMRGPGAGRGPGGFGGPGMSPPGGRFPTGGVNPTRAGRFGGGGPGGILGSPTPSAELTALLQRDAASYTWVAAAVGSNNAAGYQLASGSPVMAVGGFNGTDPAPTLEQFQALVAAKKIHYFVGGGTAMGGRGGNDTGGSDDAARIARWVRENFTATSAGGTTVYDLTVGAGS
jgi:4-amino-4-deoxy-L-arabinose transferase-like glycosyltransferase